MRSTLVKERREQRQFFREITAIVATSALAMLCCNCGGPSKEQESAVKELYQQDYAFTVDAYLEAAGAGDVEAVRWFLDAGMEPDVEGGMGDRALLAAAEAGATRVVALLLNRGAEADHRDGRLRTALIHASGKGGKEMVRLLLDAGADPEHRDRMGWSALTYAVHEGTAPTVQLLAPLAREHLDDALLIAALRGDTEKIDILVSQGANVHARSSDRQTPLMYAAGKGHAEAVRLLLLRGANRFAVNDNEETAAQVASSMGHEGIEAVLRAEPTLAELKGTAADPLAVHDDNGALLSRSTLSRLDGTRVASEQPLKREDMKMRRYTERQLPVMLQGVSEGEDSADVRLLFGEHATVRVRPGDEIPGAGLRVIGMRQRYRNTKEGLASISQMTLEDVHSGTQHGVTAGRVGRSSATFATMEIEGIEGLFEARRGDAFTAMVGQGDGDEQQLRILDVRPDQILVEDADTGEVLTVRRE